MVARQFALFDAAVRYPVGKVPTALAVADFDGDGLPDVATTDSGDGTVSILLNTSR